MIDFHCRAATANDTDFLWQMLTYAASMPEETSRAIARAKSDPYLQSYVNSFGTHEGDLGTIAERSDGLAIGAAWLRISHGNDPFRVGDPGTPELAVGLLPDYRGLGIGTVLLGTRSGVVTLLRRTARLMAHR
jgi:GNAT superfamily N-acetyltransferase